MLCSSFFLQFFFLHFKISLNVSQSLKSQDILCIHTNDISTRSVVCLMGRREIWDISKLQIKNKKKHILKQKKKWYYNEKKPNTPGIHLKPEKKWKSCKVSDRLDFVGLQCCWYHQKSFTLFNLHSWTIYTFINHTNAHLSLCCQAPRFSQERPRERTESQEEQELTVLSSLFRTFSSHKVVKHCTLA